MYKDFSYYNVYMWTGELLLIVQRSQILSLLQTNTNTMYVEIAVLLFYTYLNSENINSQLSSEAFKTFTIPIR